MLLGSARRVHFSSQPYAVFRVRTSELFTREVKRIHRLGARLRPRFEGLIPRFWMLNVKSEPDPRARKGEMKSEGRQLQR